jgi:hypothetical protein
MITNITFCANSNECQFEKQCGRNKNLVSASEKYISYSNFYEGDMGCNHYLSSHNDNSNKMGEK